VKTTELIGDMFDEGVRVGVVIHIAGACPCEESPSRALRDFIDEDLHEDYVLSDLEASAPGLSAAVEKIMKTHERDLQDGDRRTADACYRAEACTALRDLAKGVFLVQMDSGHTECLTADTRGECLGTYRGGFGISYTRWYCVDRVEDAMQQELGRQRAKKRESWQKAVNEGRVRNAA
jgi:hypothetical protein